MSDVFQTSKLQKANKEHKCDLCGTAIKPGERYWRITGKWYNGFYDTKLHKSCNALIDKYTEAAQEWEWDEDSVLEWISDKACGECNHKDDDDCSYSYKETSRCPKVLKFFKIETEAKAEENEEDRL